MHEQLLLRCIQFNIAIEHPFKYLLNYCNLLKTPSSICQAALCIVNDSLSLTQMCLEHHPAALAAGALSLAAAKVDNEHSSRSWPEHWAQIVGIEQASFDEVLKQLQIIYNGQ